MKRSRIEPEYFDDITERLSEIIIDELNKIPEDMYFVRSHMATTLMHNMVTYAAINHYEGLGMFEEAKETWRQASLAALDEEFGLD